MIPKKILFVCTICFVALTQLGAQKATGTKETNNTNAKINFVDGLTVGGYVGVGFYGGNSWFFEVSPGVGHTFLNDRFIGGIGLKYENYTQFINSSTNDRVVYNTLGPRAFLQGHISNGYYGVFEYQYLFQNGKAKDNSGTVTGSVSDQYSKYFLGAGRNGRFANGGGITAELLFDLNYQGTQTANILNRLVYRFGYFYTF
jgi:hypothetical protein